MRLYYLVFVDPYNKVCVLQSTSNMMYVMRKQLTPDQIQEVFRKLSLIFEFAVQSATAESVHADYIMTRKLKDFTKSKVIAFIPTELLARFDSCGKNEKHIVYNTKYRK